jgi:FkbM family methyltransferase
MSLAGELRLQYAYHARLRQQLGAWGALKARLLTFLSPRLGLPNQFRLHPPCLRHPVHLRVGTTDPATYLQVLVQQQYAALYDLEPEIILDCGANAGFTSAWMLSRWPRARVIAIEPFASSAALCRRNLAPYGDRAEVREAAIWSHACRLALHGETGNEWGVQVREALPGEPGEVDAIGITDLGLPRIDLLKVDIEGAETVLFGAGADRWLPRVGAIAIELHGPECDAALTGALRDYAFDRRESGELSIITSLRRQPASTAKGAAAGVAAK